MGTLMTIELKELRFHAFHGLFEEEKLAGNEFGVNLFVTYKPSSTKIDQITETIDYGRLYEIVSAEMNKRRDLLEALAAAIVEKVYQSFPVVTKVVITISKLHPPIAGFSGNVSVSLQKEI
jgi:dihydroneopterin aldolase